MDFTLLRSFLTILECRSISEAAYRLQVAQPSLSQQLLRLEDELSAKLFTRTAKGVHLTEGGRIFEKHARRLLKDLEIAREDVRESESTLRGQITLGLPVPLSVLFGVPFILAVRERHPDVTLVIEEAFSTHLGRWLDDGRIDLAFLYYGTGDLRHISARPAAREELYLVGRPGDFGRADKQGIAPEPVEPAKIALGRLILPGPHHALRQYVDINIQGSVIAGAACTEVDSIHHIKALIELGHGHSILPHAAISHELHMKRLSAARIKSLPLKRDVHLAYHSDRVVTRISVAVEAVLMEVIQNAVSERRWQATLLPNNEFLLS